MSFFSSKRVYLVIGASSNPAKFGYKVLNWYIVHKLPVIPINPTSTTILDVPVQKDIASSLNYIKKNYSDFDGFSISFITPPSITLSVLQEIESNKELKDNIKGVWFQPGSFDYKVEDKAEELKIETIIGKGDCILVSGDDPDYGYIPSKL